MLYLGKLYIEWILNYSKVVFVVDIVFTTAYVAYIIYMLKKSF